MGNEGGVYCARLGWRCGVMLVMSSLVGGFGLSLDVFILLPMYRPKYRTCLHPVADVHGHDVKAEKDGMVLPAKMGSRPHTEGNAFI